MILGICSKLFNVPKPVCEARKERLKLRIERLSTEPEVEVVKVSSEVSNVKFIELTVTLWFKSIEDMINSKAIGTNSVTCFCVIIDIVGKIKSTFTLFTKPIILEL
ncbi:MAG: hypothetical protein ACK51W_00385, partial [Aphanizomenon sp.]